MLSPYSTGKRYPTRMKLTPKKVQCTWPTPKFYVGTQRNLYSTGSRWGFALGKAQLLGFASGKTRKICVMPISHWKLGLRWLQNANEMDTNNMKCTCPTQDFCVGTQRNLYSTGLCLGFALGKTQTLGFALGVTQI